MSIFNEALRRALFTGEYICPECGGRMQFENEYAETLVCDCGHSMPLEHYGASEEEICRMLHPKSPDECGQTDEHLGEMYDEVYNELHDD